MERVEILFERGKRAVTRRLRRAGREYAFHVSLEGQSHLCGVVWSGRDSTPQNRGVDALGIEAKQLLHDQSSIRHAVGVPCCVTEGVTKVDRVGSIHVSTVGGAVQALRVDARHTRADGGAVSFLPLTPRPTVERRPRIVGESWTDLGL